MEARFPMNFSTKPTRAGSRLCGASVLACTVLVLPLGALIVQDRDPRESAEKPVKGPENNNYGTRLSAYEYAKMIEPQLGVPPVVDCGAGVEIPIYVNGKKFIGDPGIHCCDNPSLQMGDCMSGSSLQRYEGRTADGKPLPHVVWVSFARHDGRDNVFKTDVGDSVQLIGHNTKTGATAFFESGDNREWVRVDPKTNRLIGVLPGIDTPKAFNKAYVTPGRTQCVQCHQSDPFIHNPFIDAAKLPTDPTQPVVPEVAGPDSPYYVIGASHWDMRTIHIEGNGCLECHRIGMKTVEEFVGDGWDPNKHMPPHDPGSLNKDFRQLLEAWKKGPENTPGCEWIIPPAGAAPRRVVGKDYPHKAGFNEPNLHALSRLNKKPKRIPEPEGRSGAKTEPSEGATNTADSVREQTVPRFRKEIASRSREENRRELAALKQYLKRAKEEGNADRVSILSLEIRMIEEAIETKNGGTGDKKRRD